MVVVVMVVVVMVVVVMVVVVMVVVVMVERTDLLNGIPEDDRAVCTETLARRQAEVPSVFFTCRFSVVILLELVRHHFALTLPQTKNSIPSLCTYRMVG